MNQITQQRSGVTQSNIMESGVREQRPSEMNNHFEKKMWGDRCWHSLISRKVEQTDVDHGSGKFRFAALHFRMTRGLEGQEYRRATRRTPAEGPSVVQRDCVHEIASAVSHDLTRLSVAPCEDWNLLKFCKAHELEAEAENASLSVLTQQQDLLLKHDDTEHGGWVFSCGTGGGSACLPRIEGQRRR